jgi:hypothetical protein
MEVGVTSWSSTLEPYTTSASQPSGSIRQTMGQYGRVTWRWQPRDFTQKVQAGSRATRLQGLME